MRSTVLGAVVAIARGGRVARRDGHKNGFKTAPSMLTGVRGARPSRITVGDTRRGLPLRVDTGRDRVQGPGTGVIDVYVTRASTCRSVNGGAAPGEPDTRHAR